MKAFKHWNFKKEEVLVEAETPVTKFIGSDSYSGKVLTVYDGGVIVDMGPLGVKFIKHRKGSYLWTELETTSDSGYYDFGYAESYQSREF